MEVACESISGAICPYCIYEASSGDLFPGGETELHGAKGTLHARENGCRMATTIRGQFQTWGNPMDAEEFFGWDDAAIGGGGTASTANLVRNFRSCLCRSS